MKTHRQHLLEKLNKIKTLSMPKRLKIAMVEGLLAEVSSLPS
jgi:hypothetical protein